MLAVNCGLEASFAVTVKNDTVDGPAGVPLMTPVPEFKLSPDGNAPDVMVQEYGVVPPVATTGCEYAVAIVPPGNELVLMVSGGVIVIRYVLLAVNGGLELSLTVIPKNGVMEAAVGVPLITPVLEFNARPAGNAPTVNAHVYGVTPPTATSCVE